MTSYATAQAQRFSPMSLPLYRVRGYNPTTDEGYVVANWAADLASGPLFSPLNNERRGHDLAFGFVVPTVRRLVSSLSDAIAVVVPADSEEPIVGFSLVHATDGLPIVWHLHVKGRFRGQGVAADLLAMQGIARGGEFIAATVTRDLKRVQSRGTYHIHLRPELLVL